MTRSSLMLAGGAPVTFVDENGHGRGEAEAGLRKTR
jgi:hypothetical protein